MYMVVSETSVEGSPIGNIKKYEVSTAVDPNDSTNSINPTNSSNSINPVVLDSTKTPALDSNNVIKDSSKSSWSSQADGREIDKGGVGEVLLTRKKPRDIFTFLGDTSLTAESNAFDTSNKKITANLLGVGPTERDKLIQYIHGYDPYAKTKDKNTLQKRRWLLGGIANSRPLVIPYENSQSVIFVGANDGMLHAFDDATGDELWGFIPYELLGRLKDLPKARSPQYYVDGSPKAYITESQKIIVFGLGKGGNNYYALDVTNPDNPKFLWEIGPDVTGYSEMGQAWPTPQIGKVKNGTKGEVVCFIGGGYDENPNSKKGRAVYAVDLMTGAQVWRWGHDKDSNMKYSIPSDISKVDINGDGYVDRLYVGDTGGNLWRFDINKPDPDTWSGRIVFNSNVNFIASSSRKIFSRPDVTLEKDCEMVFFGTGDREQPNEKSVINQIYAIKDKGLNSIVSESDLENVTHRVKEPGEINENQGWFISLENKGEKVLSSPVVLFGVAYFTTFAPTETGNEGIARLYALNYKNGNPMLNLNPENDTEGVKIDLSDRSKVIGTGIPSSTIISGINGRLTAYTGIAGGVYNTPLRRNSPIVPIWWKEVKKDK
jgi:type IV pilus assembly protein PilY1